MPRPWSEAFAGHFRRHCGRPVRTLGAFAPLEPGPSIRIDVYEEAVPECVVCTSLGFSDYASVVGAPVEVMLPLRGVEDRAGEVVAHALQHDRAGDADLGRAPHGGVESLDPELARHYGKSALYFSEPYEVPDSLVTFERAGQTGVVLFAFFLDAGELAFLRAHPSTLFEEEWERLGVDPFELRRPPLFR